MTKIDIFSGFLGAGKTTLIKKLIAEAFGNEKLVLIENEFGDVGIDGGFMKDAGIEVTEMNSGCICCSLVGDFGKALQKVLESYHPDRILIEPSGVGKLSDVIRAVQGIDSHDIVLNSLTTVADAKKCKMYGKNFGEFFNNQIENAGTVVLSHTAGISDSKLKESIDIVKSLNPTAVVVTTDWDKLTGAQILEAMERRDTLEKELERLKNDADVCPECGHHHHDDECCHDEHDHEHHHHDHDECCHDEHDHEHHHHHDHDECCHDEHDHEHHHHHHADEVFTSFGVETAKVFNKEQLNAALAQLENSEKFGTVLRAKGIVEGEGAWLHFDYVPGEPDVREGSAAVIGRLCVIGSKLNEPALKELFGI